MAGDDLAKRKRGVVDGMADNDSPPSKRRVAHRDDAKVNKAQQKSSTNENKVKSGRTEKKRTVEVGEERLSRYCHENRQLYMKCNLYDLLDFVSIHQRPI